MDKLRAAVEKLNMRERGMMLAVCVVLGLFLAKLYVLEDLGAAFGARSTIREVEAEIAKNESMLRGMRAAKPGSAAKSPLWTYRLENAGLGGFIRKVSETGESRRDFSVRKIASDKTEQLPDYDKTRFELEVEGPFQGVGSFLEEIEASRFLTRIESVQVFRMEKELRLCRAKILVSSYSWREP